VYGCFDLFSSLKYRLIVAKDETKAVKTVEKVSTVFGLPDCRQAQIFQAITR